MNAGALRDTLVTSLQQKTAKKVSTKKDGGGVKGKAGRSNDGGNVQQKNNGQQPYELELSHWTPGPRSLPACGRGQFSLSDHCPIGLSQGAKTVF
jgi:hypothetical protein